MKLKCFIVAIASKLFERSLLRSALLKSASMFDTHVLQGNTRDKLITRFKTLLKVIMNLSVLAANSCNKVLSHFKCLLDNDQKELRLDAIKFVEENDRLDNFYFKKYYIKLSFMIRFMLTLSHGKASVERGFNLNNTVLKTNMSSNTIVARRIIKDHMLSNDLAPHTIIISPAMIKSFRSPRQKYYIHLRGGSRTASTFKMEHVMIIVNGWKNLKKNLCYQCYYFLKKTKKIIY